MDDNTKNDTNNDRLDMKDILSDSPTGGSSKVQNLDHLSANENKTTEDAQKSQPYTQGEQSISGSTPDPDSDDDTLQNAQSMGQQLGEDEEHPQELDIARDVDEAEEYVRTH